MNWIESMQCIERCTNVESAHLSMHWIFLPFSRSLSVYYRWQWQRCAAALLVCFYLNKPIEWILLRNAFLRLSFERVWMSSYRLCGASVSLCACFSRKVQMPAWKKERLVAAFLFLLLLLACSVHIRFLCLFNERSILTSSCDLFAPSRNAPVEYTHITSPHSPTHAVVLCSQNIKRRAYAWSAKAHAI